MRRPLRSSATPEHRTVSTRPDGKPFRISALALLLGAVVASPSPSAAAQLAIVAREGDPSPDGIGTYKNFGVPVMTADGSVAFPYFVPRGFQDDFTGIARWKAGDAEVLVNEATPVPAGSPSEVFTTVPDVSFALNAQGDLAYNAAVDAFQAGVLRKPDGAANEMLGRDGWTEPGGDGTFAIRSGIFGSPVTINASGSVATSVHLDGTSGGTADDECIVRFDGGGASPTVIVRRGDPAPGGLGGTLYGQIGGGFPDGTMNASGRVAFSCLIAGIASGHEGVFVGDGGPITRIARVGDAAPVTGGAVFNGFGSSALIDDAGLVVFTGSYTGVPHDDEGVFAGSGGAVSALVLQGQPAPTASGGVDGAFAVFGSLARNSLGQVAFTALATGGTSNGGLFLWDGGTVTCIARSGQTLPGALGTFIDVLNPNFTDFALGASGDVIVRSRVSPASGTDYTVLLRRSPAGAWTEIVREGGALEGSTVTGLKFGGVLASQSGARDRLGVNAAGDVAFWLQLADATRLIATTAPASAFVDVGGGSPGVNGVPTLTGSGSLQSGTTAGIDLVAGPPSAPALAWLSVASTPFAALGGTVHATPFVNQFLFPTDVAGAVSVSTTWPAGLPSGVDFWIQFICQDVTVPAGLTLSNAVRGTTP